MAKKVYPMRITVGRKTNGRSTAQVSIQSRDGSIHRGATVDLSEVSLEALVHAAQAKAEGRDEAAQEAGPIK